ncbi:hypothetical protein [Neobacillus sp. LXY-1]|uniref:hypothetical protein n=1 Tax=Neobacillus sp. LXY-1 TaxID=3379133 RepID=UPI003EDE8771
MIYNVPLLLKTLGGLIGATMGFVLALMALKQGKNKVSTRRRVFGFIVFLFLAIGIFFIVIAYFLTNSGYENLSDKFAIGSALFFSIFFIMSLVLVVMAKRKKNR